MKRAALALVLVLLFVSAAVDAMVVGLVSANPYDGKPVPPSLQVPNEDAPRVTIQSPCKTTYYGNTVTLNFTVAQPDSWFEANVSCWIKNITYQLDGQSVTLYDPSSSLAELPATKQFSIDFRGLTMGLHTLQVKVSAESIYCPNPTYFWFLVERYPMDVSQNITFMVLDLRIVGIAIAAVAVPAGIIGFAVHRKRKSVL
jgi:hypothetical protein